MTLHESPPVPTILDNADDHPNGAPIASSSGPPAVAAIDGHAAHAAVSPTPAPSEKRSFPAPSERLTQEGPSGIRYDFNEGARLSLPARGDGTWRVELRDLDTGNILFQTETSGAFVRSAKQYYVRFAISVFNRDAAGIETTVLTHEHDVRDRPVLIHFPVGTLGDTLGWFPYAARFAEVRGARVTCAMSALIIPLLQPAYPHITFVTHEQVVEQNLASQAYATYALGLFFGDDDCTRQPTDFRQVGLHRTAGYILGVDPSEAPPTLALDDPSRPIAEPYVCIAAQSSTQCKY